MAKEIINGSDFQLSVGGVAIGCATSNTFTSNLSMVEASCKETGSFYSAAPGMFTATVGVEGLWMYDNPVDAAQQRGHNLLDLHLAKTLITWEFTDSVSGHKVIAGSGYITSVEVNAVDKETVTYSVEIQVVEEYTQTVIV